MFGNQYLSKKQRILIMITVVCAVIYWQDKILVTQRSETMKLPLKWEFPGGKLEPNENEIDCIKRELREELGIEVKVLEKLPNSIHDYINIKVNLIPYSVQYLSGEIALAEHKAYKLLRIEDLVTLDWAEADIPILQHLLNTSR